MEQVDAGQPYLHPRKIVERLVGADIQKGKVDNGSRKAPGMFRSHHYSRQRDILEACRNVT